MEINNICFNAWLYRQTSQPRKELQTEQSRHITELATDTNTQTHESRINQEAVLETKEHV